MWKTEDEFPGSISLPFGIKTSHTWHEIGALLRIINDYDIESFAELGCHVGGLGTMLSGRSEWRNFKYTGFDINGTSVDTQVMDKLSICVTDIFQNADKIYKDCKSGNTFIYCDNGDKVKEMRVYSKLLQLGDIIACHDYGNGQDVYELGFCACAPEVSRNDLDYLFGNDTFLQLPHYLLRGTRIMGFVKR